MTAQGITGPEKLVLVAQIKASLEALPAKLGLGGYDAIWTSELKRSIGDIGVAAGFLACASHYPKPSDSEWLYDLIWYKNSPKHYLENLIMVLESEWNRDPDEIYYDFEKLLVAHAPIKVMIFQDHGENLEQLWRMFDTSIRTYRQGDGEELFFWAAYREVKHAFLFKQATRQDILNGRYHLA